jgi:Holliday junction resolvase RusA-like endonuclease
MVITGRPISKKRNYLRAKNGRMYLSKAYKTWETDALWQLKKYKEVHQGKLMANYVFQMKGRLSTDLDNMVAGVNDVLQKAGIIQDDKDIVCIHAEKFGGYKDWKTIIEITDLGIPSSDHEELI